MSTRKKVGISDLLRDEVQKGTESSISVAEKTIPEKTIPEKIIPEKIIPEKIIPEKIIEVTAETVADNTQRERELLQAIADLQKDLKFSQTNVDLLQKSLGAMEKLKNELDQQLVEVKRDNLRLAEANIQLSGQLSSQLSEQTKALESPKETTVETVNNSQLVSQNSPQQNRATPRKQPVEQPYAHRDRSPYVRPTGSNEQLQRINNKNIGWMD
jgi:septal ring factor EnvC (AmiA/AmiB activator)